MVLVSAAGLVSVLWDDLDAVLRFGAPIALFGLLGWAAFWQPYVEVADSGVTIANTLRTIVVPWPAVESVEGRYGLKLATAYGSFTAWAAQAPAGRDRARGRESESATLVTERLEALRAAGHLADPRLERPDATVFWHRPLIAACAVLAVATVLLPLAA
jgi:hypothetical protein